MSLILIPTLVLQSPSRVPSPSHLFRAPTHLETAVLTKGRGKILFFFLSGPVTMLQKRKAVGPRAAGQKAVGPEPIVVTRSNGKACQYKGFVGPALASKWYAELDEKMVCSVKPMHGNVDRPTHDYKSKKDVLGPEGVQLMDFMRVWLCGKLGVESVGSKNFGNKYRDGKDRTFWHLDHDVNPGDTIYILSFGAPRILTFVWLETGETYDFEIGNGDLVSFDYEWVRTNSVLLLPHQRTPLKPIYDALFSWCRTSRLCMRSKRRRRQRARGFPFSSLGARTRPYGPLPRRRGGRQLSGLARRWYRNGGLSSTRERPSTAPSPLRSMRTCLLLPVRGARNV